MICDPTRQVECHVSLNEGCGPLGFVSLALNIHGEKLWYPFELGLWCLGLE